jgi:homoserine kinase
MTKKNITVFAPATIANLSCGFDILGLALEGVGDKLSLELTDRPGVQIRKITGMDLPLDPEKNVAGVATMALLEASDYRGGVAIEIQKGIAPGSGIGSSAASSAGAVWGLNRLLGDPFSLEKLVRFAMKGEELASGAAHADNVAPALFGGITLVRSADPLDIVRVHCPEGLWATVLHPEIELKTSDSRKILKTKIPLKDGIRQWGNVGGLITGLFTEDYGLISRSLEDCIIEPVRSLLIPGFPKMRQAALEAGALGFGISGSGPSVYALCKGESIATEVGKALEMVYAGIDLSYQLHRCRVNLEGVQELPSDTENT